MFAALAAVIAGATPPDVSAVQAVPFPGAPCGPEEARARIDHVVIAVRSLPGATETFTGLGFRWKDGRLHANGLRNRHIKFRDGTEVELMSLATAPLDDMASGYASFLLGGDGGAFLALRADAREVLAASAASGIRASPLRISGVDYVTFPEPGLEGVFVIDHDFGVQDPDSILDHPNGAAGMETVWVRASPGLGALLSALGSSPCGPTTARGRAGEAYSAAGGTVVVMPLDGGRPGVAGVSLIAGGGGGAARRGEEVRSIFHHGVWLDLPGR
jgi:hypothetical protein